MDAEIREEQEAELEAIEAIFDDDYELLEEASAISGARFRVDLTDDADTDVKMRLMFTHTEQYPREAITVVAHTLGGVSGPRRKMLQDHLETVSKENVDMAAAYTVCEAARDWLAQHVVGAASGGGVGQGKDGGDDEEQVHKFETLDATQGEKVEVISSKAVGTPVTAETFAVWRERFLQELEQGKTKEELENKLDEKMTGREFFESRTMVVSAESESFWEAEAFQVDSETA